MQEVQNSSRPTFAARFLVSFYKWFHGRLHLKGAGTLLRLAARVMPGLQAYPFQVAGAGSTMLDFREDGPYALINFTMGEIEPNVHLFALMERCIEPGAVLWDVGANFGWVCLHFLQPRFGLSSIQAFEPNPSAYQPLQALYSGHHIVTVHGFGLGDQNKTMQMNVLPGASQLASVKRDLGEGHQSIAISIRRADDVQKELNLPLPDVLKIDVESFEPEVAAGLREIIAAKQPIIFFEYQFLTDEEIRGMIPAGYEILLMLDDGAVTTDFGKRVLGHDAVLFPAAKRKLFVDLPRA